LFGFANEIEAMRWSFIMVGGWWIGFSQITYRRLPEFRNSNKIEKSTLSLGIKELRKVYIQIKTDKVIKTYLTAFFIYSMVVQTIMIIAAYSGEKELAWNYAAHRTTCLIVSITLNQLVAVLGSISTSKRSKRLG